MWSIWGSPTTLTSLSLGMRSSSRSKSAVRAIPATIMDRNVLLQLVALHGRWCMRRLSLTLCTRLRQRVCYGCPSGFRRACPRASVHSICLIKCSAAWGTKRLLIHSSREEQKAVSQGSFALVLFLICNETLPSSALYYLLHHSFLCLCRIYMHIWYCVY